MIRTKKFIQAFIGVALLIGLAVVLIGLFSSVTGPQTGSTTIDTRATPTPTPPSPYDPARYGLPPTIAGYKTFAVLTTDNTACMMPGEKRLILQATQANVQDFLSASSKAAIQQDLQQRGFADFAQSNVQIVGPGTTLDQFLSENEKWNEDRKMHGCVTSVPAVPITPTQ